MDLALLADVRALVAIGATNTSDDAVISSLITSVSGRVETALARHTEAVERTEDYTLEPGGRLAMMQGYPMSAVAEVKASADGTFSDDALVEGEDYRAELALGFVRLIVANPSNALQLRVTYTGGMAANTAAFITAFPGMSGAVTTQVTNEFQRRRSPGGEQSFEGGAIKGVGPLSDLPTLTREIDAHRRNY